MSIFDRLKSGSSVPKGGPQTFVFEKLPENREELRARPEAARTDPYQVAALTVLSLCVYAADADEGVAMLDLLSGPRTLSGYDKQFLRDRIRGKSYLPFSYFKGSTPANNYTPDQPFTITVESQGHSFDQPGQATLFIRSGGADSSRPLILREQNGTWYLWEQLLMSDIRKPADDHVWR